MTYPSRLHLLLKGSLSSEYNLLRTRTPRQKCRSCLTVFWHWWIRLSHIYGSQRELAKLSRMLSVYPRILSMTCISWTTRNMIYCSSRTQASYLNSAIVKLAVRRSTSHYRTPASILMPATYRAKKMQDTSLSSVPLTTTVSRWAEHSFKNRKHVSALCRS